MATFKCPDCKTKISTAATACPKCGRPITPEDLPKPPAPKKKMALWKKILLAVLALIVLGAVFGEKKPLTPEEQAAKAELQAKKDAEKAAQAKAKEEEQIRQLREKNAKLLETATLKDYRADNDKAWNLVFAYMTAQGISEEEMEDLATGMVACLSTKAYTAQDTSTLAKDTIAMCDKSRKENPKAYAKNVDLGKFFSRFNERGEYEPISLAIFNNMNDPMSYQHEGTWYSLHLDANPPYATIETKFRGKNAFGAKVLATKNFRVNLKDLSWKEVQ